MWQCGAQRGQDTAREGHADPHCGRASLCCSRAEGSKIGQLLPCLRSTASQSEHHGQDFAPCSAVAVGWCQGSGSHPGTAQPGWTGCSQLGPALGDVTGTGGSPCSQLGPALFAQPAWCWADGFSLPLLGTRPRPARGLAGPCGAGDAALAAEAGGSWGGLAASGPFWLGFLQHHLDFPWSPAARRSRPLPAPG